MVRTLTLIDKYSYIPLQRSTHMIMRTAVFDEGKFDELLAKAVTGSVIELGLTNSKVLGVYEENIFQQSGENIYLSNFDGSSQLFWSGEFNSCKPGPDGLYIEHHDHFKLVNFAGNEMCLGLHRHTLWGIGPHGLYIIQDNNIYRINEKGRKVKLGDFSNESQYIIDVNGILIYTSNNNLYRITEDGETLVKLGQYQASKLLPDKDRIYLSKDNGIFLVTSGNEIVHFAKFTFSKWSTGDQGLFLERGGNFTLVRDDQTVEDLGFHKNNKWMVSAYGIVICDEEKKSLVVVK